MQVSVVRAELKAWEHEFLAKNGRTPTPQDIKAVPAIADKYKLYKKLRKETQEDNSIMIARNEVVLEAPKTPPRRTAAQKSAPAVIFSKSRPVQSSSTVDTKNPFSPAKKKKNSELFDAVAGPNPFLTPVKHKRALSPELIKIDAPHARESHTINKTQKRLRGDSVSPSPQPRDKRPRADAFGHSDTVQARASSQNDVKSVSPVEGESSFVDDSPVKQTVGRSFRPLFEEGLPLSQSSGSGSKPGLTRGRSFSRSKTMPGGLFGMMKKEHGYDDLFRNDEPAKLHATVKGKGKPIESEHVGTGVSKLKKKKIIPGPRGLVPEKDDLFGDQLSGPAISASTTKSFRKRGAAKLSDSEGELKVPSSSNTWGLLPPSPPPSQDLPGPFNVKGKGQSKISAKRQAKKMKISLDEKEDDVQSGDTSSESGKVQIVPWQGRSPSLEHDELRLELDSELKLPLKSHEPKKDATSPQPESLIVELPEQMQRILALSPHNDNREKEEDHLVKDIIRGKRRAIAEVWGPGEFGVESEGEGPLQEDDDWEGEGVPWEVGEL